MSAFQNEMDEILESFLVESSELIEKLGEDLVILEKNPSDSDVQNTIFRAVHTIKGTSSFLGFDQMTELAHNFEDVLNKIRKNELAVNAEIMDVIFEAYDFMKLLLERIEQKKDGTIDLSVITGKLIAISEYGTPTETPVEDRGPEISTKTYESSEAEPNLRATELHQRTSDNTIRVDVARLENIMNLVGELVLGRNRLSRITDIVNEQHEGIPLQKELYDTYSQIDFITTELQMAVMKARMVPLSKVFNKLPRLIRDLSRETEKQIEFEILGGDKELDKSIVEDLNDPLIHILRNAVDHGIESPEVRRAAGKDETGRIWVEARQEGNHMVLSVRDDGKGMDPEALKAKAVEKNIIREDEARTMTREAAFNLIFTPGFSTARQVTNVSGRGVGMDVVRTNIQKLKGIIEIDSELGKGTTFTLKLPLTLAIIQGLLTKVHREIFAIPLNSVLEVVRVKAEEIETIRGREVIRLRNGILPLVRVSSVFHMPANGLHRKWHYIVVLGLAEHRVGLVVDSLLGQKEIVIKSVGSILGSVPGIAGSTILGDGRVIMILDVPTFMKLCHDR